MQSYLPGPVIEEVRLVNSDLKIATSGHRACGIESSDWKPMNVPSENF
jgi:hypothetical protein